MLNTHLLHHFFPFFTHLLKTQWYERLLNCKEIPDIFHHPFGLFSARFMFGSSVCFVYLLIAFILPWKRWTMRCIWQNPLGGCLKMASLPLALLLMFKPGEKLWGSVTLDEWLHLWFMAHLMYFSVTLPNRILINHHIFVLCELCIY